MLWGRQTEIKLINGHNNMTTIAVDAWIILYYLCHISIQIQTYAVSTQILVKYYIS